MAEIRGIIVKKQGERAEVKVDKAESELTGLPKYIDCWNPVGAKAGDVVGAEYRDFDQRKAKLGIYRTSSEVFQSGSRYSCRCCLRTQHGYVLSYG